MTSPRAEDVKKLRDMTGAGMMDCRKALIEARGDFEAARELLRTWGLAAAAKRSGRVVSEGGIFHYIHQPNPEFPPRAGAIVEVNCETDFVAKTDLFREFGLAVARQVAAMEPRWITREDVPEDFLESESKLIRDSDAVRDKPGDVVERIVEGRIVSLLGDKGGVLFEQKYFAEDNKTMKDLMGEAVAAIGENIVVRRFARFKLGEEE